ncbi:hypothetical protein [Acidovorax sp. LjRoot66]|uniref:hypothetical protein n=1 Tax=Acidovorax sp. LjRoot66 TaxID=3342334 RepID=UPI003F4FCA28
MQVRPSRQWFVDTKTPIGEWAVAHGFAKDLVYGVLSGRIKGTRGSSLKIRDKLLEIQSETAGECMGKCPRPEAPLSTMKSTPKRRAMK